MPLTLIEGTFHLVHPTPNGNPTGFEPDGGSFQAKETEPAEPADQGWSTVQVIEHRIVEFATGRS